MIHCPWTGETSSSPSVPLSVKNSIIIHPGIEIRILGATLPLFINLHFSCSTMGHSKTFCYGHLSYSIPSFHIHGRRLFKLHPLLLVPRDSLLLGLPNLEFLCKNEAKLSQKYKIVLPQSHHCLKSVRVFHCTKNKENECPYGTRWPRS